MSNEPKIVKVAQPDGDTAEILGAPPPASVSESEIKAQIDVAKKYPRDTKKFLKEATSMVTLSEEIAESCIYTVKRGSDLISGKSVRLAEICLSAWGNCHAGARPVEIGHSDVTSQGVCWDVQNNVRITMETKRRITTKTGARYGEDMIATTTAAASSIALRNAILRVIPSAFTDAVYQAARACAVGEGEGGSSRRAKVLQKLQKMGATVDRILAVLGRAGVEDITLDDVEALIGFGTAIKDGEKTVDEVFPPLAAAPESAAPSDPAVDAAVAAGLRVAAAAAAPPAKAPPAPTLKQGTLAAVAARGRTNRGAPPASKDVDNLISGPPARLASVPAEVEDRGDAPTPEELAQAGTASDEELPPWVK